MHDLTPEEARQVLGAVRARAVSADPGAPEHWLVARDTAPPPGHTYRELADAVRRGDLDGTRTPGGLRFTAEALAAYVSLKAERRRRPVRARHAPASVAQSSERAALSKAGVVLTDKTGTR